MYGENKIKYKVPVEGVLKTARAVVSLTQRMRNPPSLKRPQKASPNQKSSNLEKSQQVREHGVCHT